MRLPSLAADMMSALVDPRLSTELFLFIMAGVLATAIDFGLFNWLTGKPINLAPILANLLSSSTGMAFKFVMSWQFVFRTQNMEWINCIAGFLLVNCVSSFGIQSLVIFLCARYRIPPVKWTRLVALRLGWGSEIVTRNAIKTAAIACGMTWNFVWSKWFVFH